jgi:hypothetical protein
MKALLILLHFWTLGDTVTERHQWELSAAIGQRGLIDRKEYVFRSTLNVNYLYAINSVIQARIGADALYFSDPSKNILRGWSREKWAYGAGLGLETTMNKVVFLLGYNRYLYFNSVHNLENPDDPIHYYSKLGFRYKITPKFTFGLVMRANSNQADYIEYGLSYRF